MSAMEFSCSRCGAPNQACRNCGAMTECQCHALRKQLAETQADLGEVRGKLEQAEADLARALRGPPGCAQCINLRAELKVADTEIAALKKRVKAMEQAAQQKVAGPTGPRRALAWRLARVLADAATLIERHVGDQVGNGWTCAHCGVHGLGVPESHRPDCEAMLVLAALRDESWRELLLEIPQEPVGHGG